MMKDIAVKYYNEGRNCAEALLMAANEVYHLGLTEENIHLVGAFGGGMGCGSTCGALCGAVAALGAMKIKTTAHEADGLRDQTAGLVAAFEEKLGSIVCKELMEKYKAPETRCAKTVELAAETVEAYIAAL